MEYTPTDSKRMLKHITKLSHKQIIDHMENMLGGEMSEYNRQSFINDLERQKKQRGLHD